MLGRHLVINNEIILIILRHHCTLGKSPQGTKEHFEVCFTASFKGKTVQCTMNELYRSGATREAA